MMSEKVAQSARTLPEPNVTVQRTSSLEMWSKSPTDSSAGCGSSGPRVAPAFASPRDT